MSPIAALTARDLRVLAVLEGPLRWYSVPTVAAALELSEVTVLDSLGILRSRGYATGPPEQPSTDWAITSQGARHLHGVQPARGLR